jgi:hypothetical protein
MANIGDSLLKNVKDWNTTILGVIVVLATLVSKFKFPTSVPWWPEAFVGISLGAILIMSPDTLIDIFKNFIASKPSPTIIPPPPAPTQTTIVTPVAPVSTPPVVKPATPVTAAASVITNPPKDANGKGQMVEPGK